MAALPGDLEVCMAGSLEVSLKALEGNPLHQRLEFELLAPRMVRQDVPIV